MSVTTVLLNGDVTLSPFIHSAKPFGSTSPWVADLIFEVAVASTKQNRLKVVKQINMSQAVVTTMISNMTG